MRANTMIHIAIRNIGDSNDPGQTYNGTVRDSLAWIINKIGEVSMAQRLVIGIGRNESDALRGIEIRRSGGAAADLNQYKSMLDQLMDGEDYDSSVAHTPSRDPLDTYKG